MSQLLRRLPLVARRCGKTRGGGGGGSFFAEGKHEPGGNLFGETPPPHGQVGAGCQSRRWQRRGRLPLRGTLPQCPLQARWRPLQRSNGVCMSQADLCSVAAAREEA